MSAAILKITIEKVESVEKKTSEWQKFTDDTDTSPQYGYVEVVRPQTNRVVVLEQSMPESKFDLAKVIKAINGL